MTDELAPGVRLLQGLASDAIRQSEGCSLVLADPPWEYDNGGGRTGAHRAYDLLSLAAIAEDLTIAYGTASTDSYLIVWWTFPRAYEALGMLKETPWEYVTGGVWGKTTGLGIGYHVRGDSEPFAVLRKGSPKARETMSNLISAPRGRHSAKPVDGLRAMVRNFSDPGDLVLSMYSGTFPDGMACALEGRQCIGAEPDPERWRLAADRFLGFAGARSLPAKQVSLF